ncbi:MAG: bifunctional DNA-formamidopyrimidine glycosylase/DNA-(apurinic or apyrimidinic site) lyase [Ilumatobacteraceae bacterium]
MPELPEVETVRRGLADHVVGRRIERVEVGRERTVRRTSPEALILGLSGVRITAANRRGKYLLCSLDSGESLMIHLRMSGRVLVVPRGAKRPEHTHVVLHLAPDATHDAQELWFVDPRTFGEVVVYDPDGAKSLVPELAQLGIDPLTDDFSTEMLHQLLRPKRGSLKAVLLDQHVVAGIGNIYADEILHVARLRPNRVPARMSRPTTARLYQAIVGVLRQAVEHGGSTLVDSQYVDLDGISGNYQLQHRVYGRAGEICLTCGVARIAQTVVSGRTTCYCPKCQR